MADFERILDFCSVPDYHCSEIIGDLTMRPSSTSFFSIVDVPDLARSLGRPRCLLAFPKHWSNSRAHGSGCRRPWGRERVEILMS